MNRAVLYQVRYGASQALLLKHDETLGFERVDDLDQEDADHTSTRTQVKDERVKPLTNRSRGLWKALAHWASFATSNSLAFDKTRHLFFVTTADIQEGTLPAVLSMSSSSPADRVTALLSVKSSEDRKLRKFIQAVRKLPRATLSRLLEKVFIVVKGNARDLQKEMRERLAYRSFREEHLDEALQRYEGWFFARVLAALDVERSAGAAIDGADVRDVLNNIRDRTHIDSVRFRHGDTPFDEGFRDTYRKRLFVRQLEAIGSDDVLIDEAMTDYFRNVCERVDWARHQDVGDVDLRNFETELYRRWQGHFRELMKDRWTESPVARGQTLYSRVTIRDPPLLCERRPQPHVHIGTYHKLADEDRPPITNIPWHGPTRRIGWHPDWEKLFPLKS